MTGLSPKSKVTTQVAGSVVKSLRDNAKFSMEKEEQQSGPIMQVPDTLEGGPVHDGLTLKGGRGRWEQGEE